MIRYLGIAIVVAGSALGCWAQTPTLADALRKAGIPDAGFSKAELAQAVDAASAYQGDDAYLAYMRVDTNNMLSGFPQLVHLDAKTKKVLRGELAISDDKDRCCGSPLGIQFTRDYTIVSFHGTPSASTMIVVNSALKPVEILFGIGAWEIAPDEVVFIENMIHFAPAHPERLHFADLRTGEEQAIYPSKGDPMRAAFAQEHKQHLPPERVCQELPEDPCDPNLFDEDIQFLSVNSPGHFAFRVNRNAVHAMAKDSEPESVWSESALYVYQKRNGQWLYCEAALSTETNSPSDCKPTRSVIPDGKPIYPSPFVKRVN